MERKHITELLKPYLQLDLFVMVLLSVVILCFHLWLGVACLIAVVMVTIYHGKIAVERTEKQISQIRSKTLEENDAITKAFVDACPVSMCIANADGDIEWVNEVYRSNINAEGSVLEILPKEELEKLFTKERYQYTAQLDEKSFWVTASTAEDGNNAHRMLYFEDVTAFERVRKSFKDSRPCLAYINVDNYDELLSASPIESQSKIVSEIENAIQSWASAMDGCFVRVRASLYTVLFEHRYLEELKAGKFQLMEQIHGIQTEADFPTTISMGIGTDATHFDQLQEYAYEAMDLAQGRGGDQTVIKSSTNDLEYFGGGLANVERKNKGKSRIMAHALTRLMNDAEVVLVMGHQSPDMDCFGAAVGICALAKAIHKTCYIVLEKPGEGIDLIFEAAKEARRFEFIGHEDAKRIASLNTLLVVVDTHIGPRTECPALLDICKRVVVIDHHRKAAHAIENTLLSYMEPYASSASEQVCEMLQYAGSNLDFGKFEMDALLAGMTLDTKNFTKNTGARTFESASWLKSKGADSRNVSSFFKMHLSIFQKKVNIIASTEILGNGVAVAYTKESDADMAMIAGQAADELMAMRGIETVFVAGRISETRSTISARSNGKVNVQVLMEKLGGGGHLNMAATQMETGPEEAIQKVVQLLREEELI